MNICPHSVLCTHVFTALCVSLPKLSPVYICPLPCLCSSASIPSYELLPPHIFTSSYTTYICHHPVLWGSSKTIFLFPCPHPILGTCPYPPVYPYPHLSCLSLSRPFLRISASNLSYTFKPLLRPDNLYSNLVLCTPALTLSVLCTSAPFPF